jgi:hypothetical protein
MATKNIPNTSSATKDLPIIQDAQGEQNLARVSSRRKRKEIASKTTPKKGKTSLKSSEKHNIA